jgi:hypothetical protein
VTRSEAGPNAVLGIHAADGRVGHQRRGGTYAGRIRFLAGKKMENDTMLTKTRLAIAAALIFGATSAVQASNENDGGNNTGGYHIGPMGQHLGGPFLPHWRGHRGAFFGFAYEPRHRRVWHHY